MKLLNFPLIKITFALCVGIILAPHFDLSLNQVLWSILILCSVLFLFLQVERRRLVKSAWFGLISLLMFMAIGFLSYEFHDQKRFKQHYTQHINADTSRTATIMFRVREVLKPNVFQDRYIVDILKINGASFTGKTLVNSTKDTLGQTLQVDDILVTTASFSPLPSPLNPGQFDYGNYLKKQYIYHQIHTDNKQLMPISSKAHTVFGHAARLRNHINTQLQTYQLKPDELALINALLLGQRQDISPELIESYSKAGAIHILAVSGLHVGLILLLLNALLKPLNYLKHGKVVKTLILVLLLWSFAIIAGLSASVTRAVTMFSIVAIGMNLKRPTNIYNTIAISIFLLLLFKPLFLFDVGFQMSYLAVISIVSLQPILVRIWTPQQRFFKTMWQIFTVTVAAQLGVAPVSLFYFHQFPGLFFVSNLVIIPILGLILGLGIMVIFLASLNILPFWLAFFYGGTIRAMNRFVAWVSRQEQFIFSDISVSAYITFAAYLMLITLFLTIARRNYRHLAAFLLALLFFQSVLFIENHSNQTSAFIIFHKNRFSLLGQKQNTRLTVSHNLDSTAAAKDQVIKNYRISHAIITFDEVPLESVYFFKEWQVLVIDSLGIYEVPGLNPDYILLRNSPQLNLSRLLTVLRPKLIIADGSNYKSYVDQWEATCQKQKVPFHLTSRMGAFIINN